MPLLSTIPPFCANFALQSRQAQRRQLNLRRNEYNIITIEPTRSKENSRKIVEFQAMYSLIK
jgi:hypothetical protein